MNISVARNLKVVVFDSIGVLFSSTVIFDDNKGEVLRTRSHLDGQGISLLRSAGLRIVFVSASADHFVFSLCHRFNNLPSVANGNWAVVDLYRGITGKDKVEVLEKWLKDNNISWDECAYMGDDIGDYHVMQKVGFRAVPADAEDIVKKDAHFVAVRNGGSGAVRDLCNFILNAKEVDITTLALK